MAGAAVGGKIKQPIIYAMSRKKQQEPKQPPIYRCTEALMRWAIPIVNSVPKSLAAQTLGGLVIRDLHDCLDAICIGLSTTDAAQRLQCIKLLGVHLTAVRTTMRVFTENRYISLDQEGDFLDLLNPVTAQLAIWQSKWESKAETVAE